LLAFGGRDGTASTDVQSALFCRVPPGCAPDLEAWTDAGVVLREARHLSSATVLSGQVYVFGGERAGAALRTAEWFSW
jgi:hypothetical protein